MAKPNHAVVLRTIVRPAKLSAKVHYSVEMLFEHLRELYNSALSHRKDSWEEEKKSVSLYDQFLLLTKARANHDEFRLWPALAQRSVLKRLDTAYQRFFKKGGYPRFKNSQRGVHSFETGYIPKIKRKTKWSCLSLRGVGKFRFRSPLPEGNIKLLRVVKTARRINLQFVMELPCQTQEDTRPSVGVDVGITNRITLSTGQTEPKRVLDRSEIVRRQRRVSKSKKGSHNRRKKVSLLRKTWQRVTERERGYLHELASGLIKTVSSKWVVEDLKIQNMVKNRYLAKSIMEQQWGRFVQYLTYKAESAGGFVRRVDPKFTSQLCSRCGSLPDKEDRTRCSSLSLSDMQSRTRPRRECSEKCASAWHQLRPWAGGPWRREQEDE